MKIKKVFFIMFFTLLILFLSYNLSFASETGLTSKAYFLMDNATGKVLYSNNENEKMYPASTTKILTATLAIENSNLADVVTATPSALSAIPEGYVTSEIQDGEQLTVEQLLELLLVHSSNDAANVLAEFTAGSVDNFIALMNKKVLDLGLKNTHFTNTYGLFDENHYTTAYDLAYIMKYCLRNDTFKNLSSKNSCNIPATNLHGPREYISTNEMLFNDNPNYYRYLVSGKTGFTTGSGECLVASAYKDDLELIGVVLGSSSRFVDMRRLFETGYSNYSIRAIAHANTFATSINVANGSYNTCNLNLLIEDDISTLLSNSVDIDAIEPTINLKRTIFAPIKKGDVLGSISYEIDGASYSSNLIASHEVVESEFLIYAIYFGIVLVILIIGIEIFLYKKSLDKNNEVS